MNKKDIVEAAGMMLSYRPIQITADVIIFMRDAAIEKIENDRGKNYSMDELKTVAKTLTTTSPTMKPFNLQQALAGKKVVTRDGRYEVTQLIQFECKDFYSLRGVIDGSVDCWTADGRAGDNDTDNASDLFMAPETKEVWVNVFREDRNETGLEISNPYANEEAAKKDGRHQREYIFTQKIIVNL